MERFKLVALAVFIGSMLSWGWSQSFPEGFYAENAASGATFNLPTALAFAPDGRIFVAEKGGLVYIIENEIKLGTPFIDLSADVLDHWDRGLLGMVLDPDFEDNGYIYFLYTWDHNGAGDFSREDIPGRLVRYSADNGNPNIADPSSEFVLIGDTYADGIPCCYWSHAIGSIRFGTDGTLLVGAGDAASFWEVDDGGLYSSCFGAGKFPSSEDIGAFRSQYLGSYAGKILRIDPATGAGLPSNPFFSGNPDDVVSKVWSYGLRNPFRFYVRNNGSANPNDGQPGSLYIGDVGWGDWEDLNIATTGGENFGWPCYEGPTTHSGYQNANPLHSDCSSVGATDLPPLHWHHWDAGQSFPTGLIANSILGATFYDGTKYPSEYQGKAFYADFGQGWLACAEFDSNDDFVSQTTFSSDIGALVEIIYDPYSEYLHYIHIYDGVVNRIRYDDESAIAIELAIKPQNLIVPAEGDTFSYRLTLSNTSGENASITFFAELETPAQGSPTITVITPKTPNLPPNSSFSRQPVLRVSSNMPDGEYTLTAYWGDSGEFSNSATFTKLASAAAPFSTNLDLANSTSIPERMVLLANYPDPFNPSTTIRYGLAESARVSIKVYNILGEEIATLVNSVQNAGYHSAIWNGINASGHQVASGIYLYTMQTTSSSRTGKQFVQTKKMMLTR